MEVHVNVFGFVYDEKIGQMLECVFSVSLYTEFSYKLNIPGFRWMWMHFFHKYYMIGFAMIVSFKKVH